MPEPQRIKDSIVGEFGELWEAARDLYQVRLVARNTTVLDTDGMYARIIIRDRACVTRFSYIEIWGYMVIPITHSVTVISPSGIT